MIIRKLNAEDIRLLPQLFEYNDINSMIAENTEDIENGTIDIFCAFQEERLLGELHVCYQKSDTTFARRGKRAYLYAFRVHKNYQRQGIGTLLLETVINKLIGEGYSEFTVGVEDDNTLARNMYIKHGFVTPIARQKESYQGDFYEYDLLLKTL